uniref:Uncharacterized protein n=1 Tax=Branchiostoma floridae TaxID=7739 RepID=C3XUE8_BRAFL|eukprot:XP_002612513.1 hypothetical protein BRAFLDRAFT_75365 [Branchiostoma floridae]
MTTPGELSRIIRGNIYEYEKTRDEANDRQCLGYALAINGCGGEAADASPSLLLESHRTSKYLPSIGKGGEGSRQVKGIAQGHRLHDTFPGGVVRISGFIFEEIRGV